MKLRTIIPLLMLLTLSGCGGPKNEIDKSKAQLKETKSCPGCELKEADLGSADLVGGNLSGAKLNKANLSSAKLNEANLSGAFLDSAKLNQANLSSANLSK